MKYSLDCYIKTNNQGIRNAVKQLIPSIESDMVWGGEYNHKEYEVEGVAAFFCSVRFHTEADRGGIIDSVKGLAGVIDSCEAGSFVREHKCYHDETPTKACEEETMLRKD